MTAKATLSEAEILAEIVEPDRPSPSPEAAKGMLALRFSDEANARIRDLLQKNNAGTITPAEKSTLDNYLRIGEFLDLIQAKARLTLHHLDSSLQ